MRAGEGNKECGQKMGPATKRSLSATISVPRNIRRTVIRRTEVPGDRSRERAGVNHEGTREQQDEGLRNNNPGRAPSNEGLVLVTKARVRAAKAWVTDPRRETADLSRRGR